VVVRKMSNYKTHIAFGLLLTLSLYFLLFKFGYESLSLMELLTITIITVIYAILPDIDVKTSKAYNILLFASLFLIILFAVEEEYLYTILITLILLTVSLLRHRGITHTVWFGLLISLPLVLIGRLYPIYGFLAYTSHLFLDRF